MITAALFVLWVVAGWVFFRPESLIALIPLVLAAAVSRAKYFLDTGGRL